MAISYEPLWATLEKLNLNMTDMRKKTGIATATMAKLRKNESLTLSMVDKICNGLHCNSGDVVKITQDSHSSTSVLEGLEVSALVRVESDDTKYNSGVIVSIISPP